jgi:hypothetical protein
MLIGQSRFADARKLQERPGGLAVRAGAPVARVVGFAPFGRSRLVVRHPMSRQRNMGHPRWWCCGVLLIPHRKHEMWSIRVLPGRLVPCTEVAVRGYCFVLSHSPCKW